MLIHGRDAELTAIERLLADARAGRSGALVLRGEAGIGKSLLLDHAATAEDMRVLRGSGIETESELPFAGLHLLLSRHTDRFAALPHRQEQALLGALGLGRAGDGDRFLVGLAVLTVLADLAEERPLACLVDDAQWLDRASADALLFAARRLGAENIAMVFAVRDVHAPDFPTPGLPEIRLGGLGPDAAADLLTDRAADLPHHVRAQVLKEADGNPLALIELSAARRDGRHADLSGAVPAGAHSRVRQSFADQIAGLPSRTQTLLFVAAADDTGSAALVLRAAERLGATVEDLGPAEQAKLIQYGDNQLAFRHPLIRAAANHVAPLGRRMAAHQALADSLDGGAGNADADRRAWHLAAVSTGADETVAAALEDSAERARALGGYAAVAAAYERAAALSPDTGHRGRRLLAAATAAMDAGLLERGATLAVAATDHLAEPLALAQAAGIRATLADEQLRVASSHRLLVEAAASVAETSAETADYLLMRSMDTALLECDLALIEQSAKRAADVLPATHAGRATNYARAVLGFGGATAEEVADGVRAFRELIERSAHLRLRETPISQWWHEQLGDDTAAHTLAEIIVQDSRDRGAAGVLPLGLTVLARSQRHLGRHHLARASAVEGLRIAHDTGQTMSAILLSNVLADLAAIEGDEAGCQDALRAMDPSRTLDSVLTACSLALLELGFGRYEQALERRAVIAAGPHRTYTLFAIPDVIEAAARLGRHDDVADMHAFYTAWAEHTGQPWARAVALRCAAQLGDPARAESCYTRALELHRRQHGRPFERARTELLYGEWLRRARRRADARVQLRSSADLFAQLSAHPWAERARTELRASGQALDDSADRAGGPTPIGRLTPQELQVVRLAARGLTNRDIGAQLFLSPRTIGYHLSNAYPKLYITSRADLRGMSFD